MHIPTLIRKTNYRLFGKIALSDAERNFAYRWAWSCLQGLPGAGNICDIGSRTSLFPAFLAWRGFRVAIVEKDARFIDAQRRISRHWNVRPEIFCGDFLEFSGETRFQAILSLFSLQHSQENDIPAYCKAAAMLGPGGLLLSACECNSKTTQWHRERDDGTLRIYGPQDIVRRIERPLSENGCAIIHKRFAGFKTGSDTKKVVWQNDAENGVFCFLCAKKKKG